MKAPSLFNNYQERINNANNQHVYNAAVFTDSFRPENASQRENEPIPNRIICGKTQCRLKDDTETPPEDIEKCS